MVDRNFRTSDGGRSKVTRWLQTHVLSAPSVCAARSPGDRLRLQRRSGSAQGLETPHKMRRNEARLEENGAAVIQSRSAQDQLETQHWELPKSRTIWREPPAGAEGLEWVSAWKSFPTVGPLPSKCAHVFSEEGQKERCCCLRGCPGEHPPTPRRRNGPGRDAQRPARLPLDETVPPLAPHSATTAPGAGGPAGPLPPPLEHLLLQGNTPRAETGQSNAFQQRETRPAQTSASPFLLLSDHLLHTHLPFLQSEEVLRGSLRGRQR